MTEEQKTDIEEKVVEPEVVSSIRGLVVCHCYKCATKRVFDNVPVNKPIVEPVDPHTSFGKYVSFLQIHGSHVGYVLIQKIEKQTDVDRIVSEISSWVEWWILI